ncbi:hypothetical protein D3C80_1734730 [compost metagenome]
MHNRCSTKHIQKKLQEVLIAPARIDKTQETDADEPIEEYTKQTEVFERHTSGMDPAHPGNEVPVGRVVHRNGLHYTESRIDRRRCQRKKHVEVGLTIPQVLPIPEACQLLDERQDDCIPGVEQKELFNIIRS